MPDPNLTETQQRQLAAILDEHPGRFDELRKLLRDPRIPPMGEWEAYETPICTVYEAQIDNWDDGRAHLRIPAPSQVWDATSLRHFADHLNYLADHLDAQS